MTMTKPNETENLAPITRFWDEHRFLSNFSSPAIRFEGTLYPSLENAYQAAKTVDPFERAAFLTLAPGAAKRQGRRVTLRSDWDAVKRDVMEELVRQKFENPQYRHLLLATGRRELIEGNNWNDTYWGVCNGRGENHLGRILMRVRDELRR